MSRLVQEDATIDDAYEAALKGMRIFHVAKHTDNPTEREAVVTLQTLRWRGMGGDIVYNWTNRKYWKIVDPEHEYVHFNRGEAYEGLIADREIVYTDFEHQKCRCWIHQDDNDHAIIYYVEVASVPRSQPLSVLRSGTFYRRKTNV